jgi:hypothetical protein
VPGSAVTDAMVRTTIRLRGTSINRDWEASFGGVAVAMHSVTASKATPSGPTPSSEPEVDVPEVEVEARHRPVGFGE